MKAFHPWLIAAFPVLALYSANLEEAAVADVVPVLAVVLAATGMLLWIFGRVYPGWDRAAIATSLLVVLAFTYPYPEMAATKLAALDVVPVRTRYLLGLLAVMGGVAVGARLTGRLDRRRFRGLSIGLCLLCALVVGVRLNFAYAWSMAAVGALWWLRAAPLDDLALRRVANTASIALVLISSIVISAGWIANPPASFASDAIGTDDPASELAPEAPPLRRDIYFLVFDRYAGSGTLREHFRYDNGAFYDSLAALGFRVADDSRANYPSTNMSMAATLNMRYLGDSVRAFGFYQQLRADHLVGRLLKRMGYRYFYLGNWSKPRDRMADVTYRVSAFPSEFAQLAYARTPLADAVTHAALSGKGDRRRTLGKIEALKEWPTLAGPKFVYAHFLLPHPPFRFGSDGGPSDPRLPADSQYLAQLEFTNGKILEMVRAILERSAERPIVILMADEGPRLRPDDLDAPLTDRFGKRTGILCALLLPDGGPDTVIPETLSPVNVFRLVFREQFGADLDLLPDRVFYFEKATPEGVPDWSEGGRLLDVTDRMRDGRPIEETGDGSGRESASMAAGHPPIQARLRGEAR